MFYFLSGPHRGTILEYEKVRKRFNNLDDALDYVISCFDGAFSSDDLSLRYVSHSTHSCRFDIFTKRVFNVNLIRTCGYPCCIGHLVAVF